MLASKVSRGFARRVVHRAARENKISTSKLWSAAKQDIRSPSGLYRLFHATRTLASSNLNERKAEVEELREEVGTDNDPALQEMLEREEAKLKEEENAEAERKKTEVLIEETEKPKGAESKHEFQAETRKILDIVARSIYSEREVFIRELISNASDALEKLKYRQLTGKISQQDLIDPELPMEIRISVDEDKKILTIQDTGIGMLKSELMEDLGRIGRSGTGEFLKVVEQGQASSNNLIGQFGVGFYSLFMVSKKVKVYSRSAKDPTAPGHIWTSDGSGTYSVSEAEGVQRGTKIIIELDEKSHEFAQRHMIENVIKKYSNFVGFDIKLNGATVNTVKAIWTLPKESLTEKDHKEFYQFIAHAYDTPMYHLHYSTDSPINVRAIFYVPEQHMEKYGLGLMEPGVNLFSRKILIQAKCKGLLPDWLRFIRGVVDSEEVPLNLSRETLQDSQLVKRLGSVLTRRILKFFEEQAKTDPEKFEKFVKEYGQFLKQGVCTDLKWKEDIAKLLRVESSHTVEGQVTSFDDYISRMVEKQQNIYYLVVPSRANAEASPYFETFKARGVEVMFLYQSIDDFVMTNLGEYKGKKVVSIESSNAAEEIYNLPTKKTDDQKDETEEDLPALTGDAFKEFATWLKEMLVLRVTTVTESARLSSSPAIVVDHESAAFRRMMRAVDPGRPTIIPKVQLQINPKHPIITRLDAVRKVDGVLAQEAAEQIMDNALIQAGLIEDSRTMVPRLNKLLERALKVASHPATPSDTTN